MRRMISVVDLTRARSQRGEAIRPRSIFPETSTASPRSRRSTPDPKRAISPRRQERHPPCPLPPLSSARRGEECLVADDGEMPTISEPSHYTLCAIEF